MEGRQGRCWYWQSVSARTKLQTGSWSPQFLVKHFTKNVTEPGQHSDSVSACLESVCYVCEERKIISKRLSLLFPGRKYIIKLTEFYYGNFGNRGFSLRSLNCPILFSEIRNIRNHHVPAHSLPCLCCRVLLYWGSLRYNPHTVTITTPVVTRSTIDKVRLRGLWKWQKKTESDKSRRLPCNPPPPQPPTTT